MYRFHPTQKSMNGNWGGMSGRAEGPPSLKLPAPAYRKCLLASKRRFESKRTRKEDIVFQVNMHV